MRQPTAEFTRHGTPAVRRSNLGRCAAGVAGAAGDLFYADCGWNGVAALIGIGLLVAWRLYYLPLPQSITIEPALA